MKIKIEFYENGNGLSFDLESNTIIKSNGDVETLSHNNIEERFRGRELCKNSLFSS